MAMKLRSRLQPRNDSEYVGTREAASMLGVTQCRVQQYVRAGRLPAERIGVANRSTFRMLRADVESFVRRPPGTPGKGVVAIKRSDLESFQRKKSVVAQRGDANENSC